MESNTANEVQFQNPSSQMDCKISLEVVIFEGVSVMKIRNMGGKQGQK
jgi:hypothetical protein